jgi:epoxyqueuosine reductase
MDKLSSHYEKTGYGHNRYVNRQFRMRLFPRDFCPDARTIIVAAQPIPPGNVEDKSEPGCPRGINATNYAREGKGWYDVLEHKLDRLAESIREMGHFVQPSYEADFRELPGIRPRYSLLLRAAAIRSGIGQRGKNALIYTKEFGSFVVLSALYIDAEVPVDEPSDPETSCGKCTICQDACPHDALDRAFALDAQSCMSIVYDEVLANPLVPLRESRRIKLDNRFVGCDICQSVARRIKTSLSTSTISIQS